MSNITKGIICIIVLAGAVALGRFTAPEKVKIETKTVTVTVEKTVVAQNTHSQTVEEVKPDGSKVTTIVTDTSTHSSTSEHSGTSTSSKSETTYNKGGVTIQALAGINIARPADGFTFGASISKPLLGPIVLGVFGFTDGRAGISAGFKF